MDIWNEYGHEEDMHLLSNGQLWARIFLHNTRKEQYLVFHICFFFIFC